MVEQFTNLNEYENSGALGLGLLDNLYNFKLEKFDIEFFQDFDNGNKPINEFMISLNDKNKKYVLSLGYDEKNSLENQLDYEWIYIPKNLQDQNYWHIPITHIYTSYG